MAHQESMIEAVRNRKTQKLFIVVDDTLDTRYKVINPFGEIIVLPDLLFDEDPVLVPETRATEEFTPEQLDALIKHNEKAAADAAKELARPKLPPPRVNVAAPVAKRSKAPKEPVRRGLGATWDSPRLSFYRHKIDPLHAKQTFRIKVEGVGEFEISKEEFLLQFNDVVMSPSYRSDGLYTYTSWPEKAKKYLRS